MSPNPEGRSDFKCGDVKIEVVALKGAGSFQLAFEYHKLPGAPGPDWVLKLNVGSGFFPLSDTPTGSHGMVTLPHADFGASAWWHVRARTVKGGDIGDWSPWAEFKTTCPEARCFPAAPVNNFKAADTYLQTNGCTHVKGTKDEYLCTNECGYQYCETYLNDPKLGIKKCLRAKQ